MDSVDQSYDALCDGSLYRMLTDAFRVSNLMDDLTEDQIREADEKLRHNEELEQTFVDLAHEMAQQGITPEDEKLAAEMNKALSKRPRSDRKYLYDKYLSPEK